MRASLDRRAASERYLATLNRYVIRCAASEWSVARFLRWSFIRHAIRCAASVRQAGLLFRRRFIRHRFLVHRRAGLPAAARSCGCLGAEFYLEQKIRRPFVRGVTLRCDLHACLNASHVSGCVSLGAPQRSGRPSDLSVHHWTLCFKAACAARWRRLPGVESLIFAWIDICVHHVQDHVPRLPPCMLFLCFFLIIVTQSAAERSGGRQRCKAVCENEQEPRTRPGSVTSPDGRGRSSGPDRAQFCRDGRGSRQAAVPSRRRDVEMCSLPFARRLFN